MQEGTQHAYHTLTVDDVRALMAVPRGNGRPFDLAASLEVAGVRWLDAVAGAK